MPDARVQAAIDNWAPRMVSQGIDYNDFVRTTARIERWDEWLDQWCDTAELHLRLAREAEEAGRRRTAGEAFVRAALCFHFAKYVWVLDGARNRDATERAREALYEAHRLLDPNAERVQASLDGGTIVANLRRPPGIDRPALVIMVPGLDSTKEEFRATEALFLERDMATFSVDGPGQGEAEYELAIRADWEVPGATIVEYLAAQPGIDPDRIGVWGVSLGGYYAPRVAAGVDGIKACIALAGPYNFGEIWDGLPPLTRDTFRVRSKTPDDDAARARALTLSLEGRTQDINVPLHVVMGKLDRLIPYKQAERLVDEVGDNADFLLLDDGNHGCANVSYKHRYRSADWMAEHLKA